MSQSKDEDLFSKDMVMARVEDEKSNPASDEEELLLSLNSDDLKDESNENNNPIINNTQELLDGLNDNINEEESEKPNARKFSEYEENDDDFEIPDDLDLSPNSSDNPSKKIKLTNLCQDDDLELPSETFGFVNASTMKKAHSENFEDTKHNETNKPTETFGFVSASRSKNLHSTSNNGAQEMPPETFGFISASSSSNKTKSMSDINDEDNNERPPETFGFVSASSSNKLQSKLMNDNDERPPETFGFESALSSIRKPQETFGFVSAKSEEKPPETFGFQCTRSISTIRGGDTFDKPPETFGFVSAKTSNSLNSSSKMMDDKEESKINERPPETFGFVSASSSNKLQSKLMNDNDERPPETFGFQSASIHRPPETFGFQKANSEMLKHERPPTETFGFISASSSKEEEQLPAETFGFVRASASSSRRTFTDDSTRTHSWHDLKFPPPTEELISDASSSNHKPFKTPSKIISGKQSTPESSEPFATPVKGASSNNTTPKRSIKTPFASYLSNQKKETPTNRVLETTKKKQKKFKTPMKSEKLFEEATKRERERSSKSSSNKTTTKSDTTPICPPSWVPVKKSLEERKSENIKSKPRKIQLLGDCKQISIESLKTRYNLSQVVVSMNSTSSKNFKFDTTLHKISQEMLLAIQEENEGKPVTEVGTEQLQLLLHKFGAKKEVTKIEWVENHFRWIVWKLASMDRTFPNDSSFPFLTPEKVLGQLVYRYNVEYCMGKRSCLKQIAEKDVPPGHYIVLVVASLDICESSDTNSDSKIIELSDGWYSMKAKLDEPLTRYVEWKKIKEGQKLKIIGANFTENFEAAPPLELPGNACLKLSVNGVKKAKWDAMLGFQYRQKPFKTSFKSIQAEGGNIPYIRAIVKRVYPIKYFEKQNDGITIVRTKAAEDHAANIAEKEKERISSNLFQTYYDEEKRKRKGSKTTITTPIKRIYEGSTLYNLLQSTKDEMSFYAQLDENQRDILSSYQQQLESDIYTAVNNRISEFIANDPKLNREVSSMLSVKLGDCCPYLKNPETTLNDREIMLTLWKTDEDSELFQEGNILDIYNCRPSKQSANQVMKSITTVSFTKIEIFKSYKDLTEEEMSKYFYTPRRCFTMSEMKDPEKRNGNNEMDFVGILIHSKEIEQKERDYTLHVLFFVDNTCLENENKPTILQLTYIESAKRQFIWLLSENKVYFLSNIVFSEFDETNGRIKCHAKDHASISERANKFYFRQQAIEVNNFFKSNKNKILSLAEVVNQYNPREEFDFSTPRKMMIMEDETIEEDISCNIIINQDFRMHVTLLDTVYNTLESYSYPNQQTESNPVYRKAEDVYSYFVKLYIDVKDMSTVSFFKDYHFFIDAVHNHYENTC